MRDVNAIVCQAVGEHCSSAAPKTKRDALNLMLDSKSGL